MADFEQATNRRPSPTFIQQVGDPKPLQAGLSMLCPACPARAWHEILMPSAAFHEAHAIRSSKAFPRRSSERCVARDEDVKQGYGR